MLSFFYWITLIVLSNLVFLPFSRIFLLLFTIRVSFSRYSIGSQLLNLSLMSLLYSFISGSEVLCDYTSSLLLYVALMLKENFLKNNKLLKRIVSIDKLNPLFLFILLLIIYYTRILLTYGFYGDFYMIMKLCCIFGVTVTLFYLVINKGFYEKQER
ncbi:hypothetical protein Cyrtocomes_00335 [Candidatus Cyrtobacter comes]|uniref:Rod shape-determining protein MreD n=1 Tax=Candidatus Cyrtobacter comes TaxID=675776 RepID=A0ABU5L762_9RICK|nr:hypothetical protein [Candidatus Cyrtobacter comes]